MSTNPESPSVKNRRVLLVRRLAISAVMMVAVWLLCSVIVANHYVRRALPKYDEPAPVVEWGQIQPLRLHTVDGEELGTWFIPGKDDQAVVLFLHGNGGSRSACLGRAEALVQSGYSVMLISLRAHGDSTGQTNDFGYSARHDVVAAVEWLKKNQPGKPIIVWGQSLGSAAAVFAAGELGQRVRGYILECPYKDLRTAVWNRIKTRLPPVLDEVAYLGLLTVSPLYIADMDKIAPVEAISQIPSSTPVLLLAGGQDRRAPPEDAQALAARIADHVQMKVFDGAEHLQLQTVDPAGYQKTIADFLAGCESRAP